MSENVCPCGDELTEARPICPDCFPLAADKIAKLTESLKYIATFEPADEDYTGLDAVYMKDEARTALGMSEDWDEVQVKIPDNFGPED